MSGAARHPARGHETAPAWPELLRRRSFSELTARQRAHALVDDGTGRELCGPFDELESPWLEPQGVVPQADDGAVIVKGEVAGAPVVVIAIEQAFLGGGIGEVSGAKLSSALSLAAADSRAGVPTGAILLLETGGVRLQEANLGLAAVAEVCSALLELRACAPVVAVIAGPLGSFGGLSIAAGLSTAVIMTAGARLGLNGPEVIESEAGIGELDSRDRPTIWEINGGATRVALGHADELVPDDTDAIRRATHLTLAAAVGARHRSEDLVRARRRLVAVDPATLPDRAVLAALWGACDR